MQFIMSVNYGMPNAKLIRDIWYLREGKSVKITKGTLVKVNEADKTAWVNNELIDLFPGEYVWFHN